MINFDSKTYNNILNSMLSNVPDSFDKRDTSPIQTALGPAAYAIEEIYLNLNRVQLAAAVQTATGSDLESWALVANVSRKGATPAVRLGTFDTAISEGARFSTINGADSINFTVGEEYQPSSGGFYYYKMTAETPGSIGNDYSGPILPISVIPGLTSAEISSILIQGDDEESDDELRAKIITALNDRPFGGNIASYRSAVMALPGVGGVQIYPVWNGGGTVKLSIVGPSQTNPEDSYLPASAETINEVQTAIDPTVNQGVGIGIAPVGAVVTVVAPDDLDIDITGTVTLAGGYTLQQVTPLIEAELEKYLESIRAEWATPDAGQITYSAAVYYARIVSAILSAEGVVNVTSVTVNSGTSDITLTEDGSTQEVPVLGTVTLNE